MEAGVKARIACPPCLKPCHEEQKRDHQHQKGIMSPRGTQVAVKQGVCHPLRTASWTLQAGETKKDALRHPAGGGRVYEKV